MNLPTNIENSFLQYVPILTPVVKKDRCELDDDLFMARIRKVAIAIGFTSIFIGFQVIAFSVTPIVLLAIPAIIGIGVGILYMDAKLSRKALDIKAVNEFAECLSKKILSTGAYVHVRENYTAAQLLVNKKIHLRNNFPIASFFRNFDIFKLFMDNGAPIKPLPPNLYCFPNV